MKDTFDILRAIRDAIEKEMVQFAEGLQEELTEKYEEEFAARMYDHRRKVVLDVCENIEIAHMFEPKDLTTNITIKL